MLSIIKAYNRIKPYIYQTPILYSDYLNHLLGHEIYFKAESLQKSGSFKIRGVLNHLLALQEKKLLPTKISTYTTGNHGIAVALVAKLLKLNTVKIYSNCISKTKLHMAKHYGAKVILTNSRIEAEQKAKLEQDNEFYYLHPSDSDSIIAGAGTVYYEALQQLNFSPDAVFASCGGGGLLSGTYLTKIRTDTLVQIIGSEPVNANDAFTSLCHGNIFTLPKSPNTVADGLSALNLSERTFQYIKKLDDMVLVPEKSIYYWTTWLITLLKITCEPSSAINMAAVCNWLLRQNSPKKALVILSGGNTDPNTHSKLMQDKFIQQIPKIEECSKGTISFKNS
ncbi:pyridoxal-phosphate dependent enzyme family protein [Orientia tsutsugamushi str. UT144]|uniref:Pyridoxal-phosphate dependent enzyme family protein n=2 Tax=Orientia tsutsugamushi str. UT144 TaxID=1441384 RepID=A0A0F3RHI0_ORITS|nr:serine/threonine dehydratase [Orientia tsutsugamushi]KJW05895.1 pyridoxal-phosphate dependent enzyme family protein [Orientia tsutsugamushi str. UT144]